MSSLPVWPCSEMSKGKIHGGSGSAADEPAQRSSETAASDAGVMALNPDAESPYASEANRARSLSAPNGFIQPVMGRHPAVFEIIHFIPLLRGVYSLPALHHDAIFSSADKPAPPRPLEVAPRF